MVQTKITLINEKEKQEFLRAAESLAYDVDIVKGKNIHVDGKSLLGLFSVDMREPVDLILHTNNSSDLILFEEWRCDAC